MNSRDYYINFWKELSEEKSMVFISGPRQSGKTTLAFIIAESYNNHLYFNWDIPKDKILLLNDPAFFESLERKDETKPLIILDEIHKHKDWKNYLKGVYDQFHREYQFLISGSGRLDLFQKGGDSLAGRYFLFHLYPFTIAELAQNNMDFESFIIDPCRISTVNFEKNKNIWTGLSELSGFPEPFLSGRKKTYQRWSNIYTHQIIREDIRDMTQIKSIQDIEMLYLMLPSKIGSPLSIQSLSNDLKVSYNSVNQWLSVFERYFVSFSIHPWASNIPRAIHKGRKIYIWDTPRIKNDSAKFENMVALELYRAIKSWNDIGYGRFSLHFIRNKEQQEVDFLIVNDGSPFLLIEAKMSDMAPSPNIYKFQSILDIPAIQLVKNAQGFRTYSNAGRKILSAPAGQWLSFLP